MTIELAHPRTGSRWPRSALLWLGLLFFGCATLGAWFLIHPALVGGRYYKVGFNQNTYEYSRQILPLFIPYALALWAWRRGSRVSARWLLGGAIVLHILVLFAPLPQSQDFYQYLFYGRMQAAHGANPYLLPPSTFWADRWFPWIRWSDQTSVYGPVWMLLTWGVAKASLGNLAASFVLLKLVILGLDLAIMAMIVQSSRDRSDAAGVAGWGLLVFAWNPLVLVTVPLGGAADVALAAAFVGAILARRRGRTGVATLLLTLGALVKLYGAVGILLHLALVYRERGWKVFLKHAAAAGALIAAAYMKYWAGLRTFSGLFKAVALTDQSVTGTVQRLLVPLLHDLGINAPQHASEIIVRVAAGALLAASIVWALVRVRDERSLWYCALVVLAAYLYLTPWFLYWYTVAPLAMIAVLPRNRLTYPILVFSGSSLFIMGRWAKLENWIWQTLVRYVPPLAVLARSKAPGIVERRPNGGRAVPIPVPSTPALVQPKAAAR